MKETITTSTTKTGTFYKASLLDKWLDVIKIIALDRIRTEEDYDRVVTFMQKVIAEIGRKKNHPLNSLMDILEMRIREYDDANHPIDDIYGIDMLRFLMTQHGLKQKDLPELGSQGVVSEILSGKRELNVQHINALAKRFHVPPAVFLANN